MSWESFGEERLEEYRGAFGPVLVGHLCIQLCLSHRHLLHSSPDRVLSANRNWEVGGGCKGGRE